LALQLGLKVRQPTTHHSLAQTLVTTNLPDTQALILDHLHDLKLELRIERNDLRFLLINFSSVGESSTYRGVREN
jgi:hypothetical protein